MLTVLQGGLEVAVHQRPAGICNPGICSSVLWSSRSLIRSGQFHHKQDLEVVATLKRNSISGMTYVTMVAGLVWKPVMRGLSVEALKHQRVAQEGCWGDRMDVESF